MSKVLHRNLNYIMNNYNTIHLCVLWHGNDYFKSWIRPFTYTFTYTEEYKNVYASGIYNENDEIMNSLTNNEDQS